MSERQPQKFFRDLYKDLDERHLLLPVIALVVAIIAVPLLLGGGEEPITPAPSVAAPDADATAVESAVLTEATGIRGYRERLEQMKSKNPFKQQFVSSGSSDEAANPGAEAIAESGLPSGEVSVGGVPLVPADSVGAETSPSTETQTQTVTETETVTKEVTRLITRRIDVNVGPLGATKRVRGVKELTLLPSKQAPVVAFVGVSEDAKRATFAVSADVASTSGAGSCIGGGPIACEFLTLELKQEQTFQYEPDGQTYRLKLLDIEDVEVRVPGKSGD